MSAKEKPGASLAGATGRRKLLIAEYHALHLLQAPFRFVFWRIEQRKARLQDQLSNIEAEQ